MPGSSRYAGTGLLSIDRKSTRLNSSHLGISYAVFCLKKKKFFVKINEHIFVHAEGRPRRLSGLADVAIASRSRKETGGTVGLLDATQVVLIAETPVE